MDEAEIYKKIGEKIRSVRIEKGMSQAELADLADISLPHISDIDLGKTQMKLATFKRVAEALETSADDLIRLTNVEPLVGEVNYLLSDCTTAEKESILKILKELKKAIQAKKNND